jgi:hypothetical protein
MALYLDRDQMLSCAGKFITTLLINALSFQIQAEFMLKWGRSGAILQSVVITYHVVLVSMKSEGNK